MHRLGLQHWLITYIHCLLTFADLRNLMIAFSRLPHSVRAKKIMNKKDFFYGIITQNAYLSYEQVEQADESPLLKQFKYT